MRADAQTVLDAIHDLIHIVGLEQSDPRCRDLMQQLLELTYEMQETLSQFDAALAQGVPTAEAVAQAQVAWRRQINRAIDLALEILRNCFREIASLQGAMRVLTRIFRVGRPRSN